VVRPAGEGEVVPELTYKGRRKRLFLFALFSPLAPLLYIWTVTYVSCALMRRGTGLTMAYYGCHKHYQWSLQQATDTWLRSPQGSMYCVSHYRKWPETFKPQELTA
jgi:hypothetical protein